MAVRGDGARPLFDRAIVQRAAREAVRKLSPLTLWRNPVIFVVEVGAALTTMFAIRDVVSGTAGAGFGMPNRPMALVHSALRDVCRGDG